MVMSKPDFGLFTSIVYKTLFERNRRYGTKNIQGPAHVFERAKDKMARVENAIKDGGLPTAQDWEDLAGYAAVGWLLDRGLWDDRSTLRRVYFAHPAGDEAKPWMPTLDLLHRELAQVFGVYRPVGPFTNVYGHADWVWRVCLQAIALSDMLVAGLPFASNGTAAEMLYAKERGKTVWAVRLDVKMAESSLVQYAADRLFFTVSDLAKAIKEVRVEVPADTAAS